MNKWWAGGIALLTAAVVSLLFLFPIRAVHAQVTSVSISWTAPADPPSGGAAASYEVRWSASRPDTTGQAAWINAGALSTNTPAGIAAWQTSTTSVVVPTAPKAPGSPETFAVPGSFTTGRTYWFELKTCDAATDSSGAPRANCSWSNVTSKFLPDTTPPRAVVDLRAL